VNAHAICVGGGGKFEVDGKKDYSIGGGTQEEGREGTQLFRRGGNWKGIRHRAGKQKGGGKYDFPSADRQNWGGKKRWIDMQTGGGVKEQKEQDKSMGEIERRELLITHVTNLGKTKRRGNTRRIRVKRKRKDFSFDGGKTRKRKRLWEGNLPEQMFARKKGAVSGKRGISLRIAREKREKSVLTT